MKAQETVNFYKEKSWLESASEDYCYKATNNEKVCNLFYHSASDTKEVKDGYFFIFDDKSSVEYDGKLFVVNDPVQSEYKLNLIK